MFRWLILNLVILFAIPGFSEIKDVYGHETVILKTVTLEEKQYLSSEQVIISERGIEVVIDDIVYPVAQLNSDPNGLYVLRIDLGCTKHRPVCVTCGGCVFWGCPYRCACYR